MHGTDRYVQSDHRTTACGRHDDIDEQTKPGETRFHGASQSASEPPTACGRACVTRTYAQFAQTTTFKHGGRLHTADEQLTTTTMTITGSGGVGTYLSRGTSVSLRISFLGNGLTVGCSCSLASRENRQRNRVSTHWHNGPGRMTGATLDVVQ